MSLIGFETALAALLRVGPQTKDVNNLFIGLDLDDGERTALAELAANPEVLKYGREQAWGRWTVIQKNLLRLGHFVESNILYDIFINGYEPQALRGPSDADGHGKYTLGFLDFLLLDTEAQVLLAPYDLRFINELIQFERAEIALSTLREPAQTHLVLDLSFDLPALFAASTDGTKDLRGLYQRPLTLLLVRQGTGANPRLFELGPEWQELDEQGREAALGRELKTLQISKV